MRGRSDTNKTRTSPQPTEKNVAMGRRRGGLDWLRALNPVEETDVEGPDSARAQDLLAEILARPRESGSGERYGWKPLRVALAMMAVLLVTTAAAWIWTALIDKPNAISCYQAPSLDADIAAAPAAGEASAETCAVVWQDGILENLEIVATGSIPPLTACISETGGLAVFPTDDTTICGRLGLAHPDPGGQSDADSLRTVEETLISYFQSETCIRMDEAQVEVRRILDDARLVDWRLNPQPEHPDRPCASHSFDPETRTIHLIPIPEN